VLQWLLQGNVRQQQQQQQQQQPLNGLLIREDSLSWVHFGT
jgi:hypothetical protein